MSLETLQFIYEIEDNVTEGAREEKQEEREWEGGERDVLIFRVQVKHSKHLTPLILEKWNSSASAKAHVDRMHITT